MGEAGTPQTRLQLCDRREGLRGTPGDTGAPVPRQAPCAAPGWDPSASGTETRGRQAGTGWGRGRADDGPDAARQGGERPGEGASPGPGQAAGAGWGAADRPGVSPEGPAPPDRDGRAPGRGSGRRGNGPGERLTWGRTRVGPPARPGRLPSPGAAPRRPQLLRGPGQAARPRRLIRLRAGGRGRAAPNYGRDSGARRAVGLPASRESFNLARNCSWHR